MNENDLPQRREKEKIQRDRFVLVDRILLMTTLTFIFALPLLAAIALAFVPRNFAVIMRAVAVGVTFVTMVLAMIMFCPVQRCRRWRRAGYQFEQQIPTGCEALGISFHVGVDGINVGLVLMGAIVAFAAACCLVGNQGRARRNFTSCCW